MESSFAEYILAERDWVKKMEIMYYHKKKASLFFDPSVVFKTLLLKLFLEVTDLEEKYVHKISTFKNVESVSYTGTLLLITYKKGKNNLVELMDYLKNENIKYNKIYSERPTLNDVFLELTGKELRD